MKKLLLIAGLITVGFVACKDDDDDDPVIPTPLPTVPTGQYRIAKMEFRDSTNHLVQNYTYNKDSSFYVYYNQLGQYTKAVTVQPTECFPTWSDFEGAMGFAYYDSTQFFPATNSLIMHFYLGWQSQGIDDPEYMYMYLVKSAYLQADTVSCN